MTASPEHGFDEPPIERVRKLTDVIREGGDQAQKLRRVPDETVSTLIDAGLFRFTLPSELGGEDAGVRETIEVIEEICAIDASVGWNVMLGSEINAMAVGGMPAELAREIYVDNPRVVMCGGGGPGSQLGRAVRQDDGGYRIWGQSSFISGCHNSEWCFMPAGLFENDAFVLDANGIPQIKMWFLNRKEFEILDTWDVAGLRGSGSHDVKADGAYVPERLAGVELMALPPLYDNPVYRIPIPLRLAYNKAAVGTGVARGALDFFSELAQNKVPLMSTSKLMDRPVAQQRMGEAEATLRSVRAFLFEAMEAVEEELRGGLEAPSGETTQTARLACIHAANQSMHVVDLIHNTAGTSASYIANPLERKLRDAHGAASHRWVSHPLYAELGKIYLGHEPGPEFAGGLGSGGFGS